MDVPRISDAHWGRYHHEHVVMNLQRDFFLFFDNFFNKVTKFVFKHA